MKHFTTYFIFSIINAGVSLIISVLLARTLSVDDFGMIGILLAILYFMRPMASFNTIGLVSINKIALDKNSFQIFSNNFFSFVFIILIILFIMSSILSYFYVEYTFIILFIPVLIFVSVFGEFHNTELIQEKKSISYGLYIFLTRIITLAMTLFLIILFDFGWSSYLWGLLLAEGLVLVIRIKRGFPVLKTYKVALNRNEIRKIIYYGAPLFIALLAGWGLNQADKFIVLHYFSLTEVAFYTVAYSLGVIINTINQALTNTIVPHIYRALKQGLAKKIIFKYTMIYSFVISLLIVFIGISSFYFVPVFYGIEYEQSVIIVILISIAFGFNGIYRITGMVIEYHKYNMLKTKLIFISMVINIVFSFLLLKSFGIIAPAIGTITGYMFLALSSQFYGYKILRKKYEKTS